MAKTIAVWGSPGSRKSMFCCVLAKLLTKDKKKKAIIISGDTNTPMLPVWLPNQIIEAGQSVGHVLTSLEIDTAITAQHVVVLKSHPFIGVMGYAAKETPLSYPEIKYEKIKDLIYNTGRLVDYIILDCPSNLTNLFTPAAIESSDIILRVLTPDLKGVNYLQAQQALLSDLRFRYNEHLSFAGLARPFHAIDEMGHIIGGFSGLLPYSKEVDRCATEGGMFEAIHYVNKKYILSLQKAVEKIREGDEPEMRDEDQEEARRKPHKAEKRARRRKERRLFCRKIEEEEDYEDEVEDGIDGEDREDGDDG